VWERKNCEAGEKQVCVIINSHRGSICIKPEKGSITAVDELFFSPFYASKAVNILIQKRHKTWR
jgi:hypothetical protein